MIKQKNKIFEPFDWKALGPSVIGVDEAGRGCLAGRVYAGAVLLMSEQDVSFYTDSKVLSEKRREELFKSIITHHRYGVGYATALEIDEINILNAAHLAMSRAIEALGVKTGHVLVDGNMKIRGLTGYEQTALVKGDLRAAPVAAASIIAKVSRDHYAEELSKKYPKYDFEKHKGYPTAHHKELLIKHGPSPEHRTTFSGVKELVARP